MTTADIEAETRWTKHREGAPVAILGKEIVAISTANFIAFVDSTRPEKKDALYSARSEVRGDGVQCFCTHKYLQCFAFAERGKNPYIFVVYYPSFEVFRKFQNVGCPNYLALTFSEMDFLLALTGIPDFKLIIWNWRTEEKLYSQDTELTGLNQILRISPTSPMHIVQCDINEKQICLWEMRLCHKKTLLNKKLIPLPNTIQTPYCLIYGTDGEIYFVDSNGSLYSINTETHICSQQYPFTGYSHSKYIPCLTWYKGGLVFATPMEILFLRRKSPEGWLKIWSFPPKVNFRALRASSLKDLLIGVTNMNEIFILKGETQIECVSIRYFGTNFDFVCFVQPLGEYLITFGNLCKLFTVWNKISSQKIYQLNWYREKINDIKSNPKWPYLVVVTEDGWTFVMNAYQVNNLTELDSIYLTANSLDAIRFRGQGHQFCVANMEFGEFFLLKLTTKIEVSAYVKVDLKIVDYAILETNTENLVIVPMSQMCCRSGQNVLLYALNEKYKRFEYLKDVTLPSVITSFLPSPLKKEEIICTLHRSRKFCFINFLTGKIVSQHVSGHQMKIFQMIVTEQHLFTFGVDGIFMVRELETKKCVTMFATHHRLLRGIRVAVVDPYVSFIVTIGNSGVLIGTAIIKIANFDQKQANEELMSSPAYKQFLQISTPLQKSPKKMEKIVSEMLQAKKLPWVEMRYQEMLNVQEQHSRKEKQNILEEFQTIKRKVVQLLEENLSNVSERQLPVHAFDLDKPNRRKKIEDAKVEREKLKQFKLASIKCYTKITDTIKAVCWQTVVEQGREIHGIAAPISVQSYALIPNNKLVEKYSSWLKEKYKLRRFLQNGDCFEPWIPMTPSELEAQINAKFEIINEDVTETIKTRYEYQMEDEKAVTTSEDQESKHVWSGTSSHCFIEVDIRHFSQFELVTFIQSHQELIFIQKDIRKLMEWFNKKFAEIFEVKEREMAFICERNNRLRHIINELSFFNFSPHICSTIIYDPEWLPEENPENIMTVHDSEVKVPKYISTSEMELIMKKEAEEEKFRKMLMADDFREKALIVMMDGVLEKLWEDELKKNVPQPKCMIDKQPEDYTEDDLKAVKAYEDAVKALRIERERYRKILEGEWVKTTATVRDTVAKFDEKVVKFHLLKLKVESAIGQEALKSCRIRQTCYEKISRDRQEDSIKTSLAKNEKKTESLTGELNKLVEILNECKNLYETLQNKDKNIDKNFKKEFPELTAIVCEHLYKVSKKRPKLMQKAAMYPSLLIDLGKAAVAGTKPDNLPPECIQYLKDLDALDAYSNAPASVTQQSWEVACKLRRLKIETELRLRASAVDLADAEATVASFQKSLKLAKEEHSHLQSDLHKLRQEKANAPLNYQIQLVLKKGLVEIPLSGRISDFEESILVTKETLNEVNRAIQKMGEQKIKAMNKATNFRKGIIYKEWEHKKLRMQIEDLKGQLDTVEKLQVLKELQALLVARARGITDEKGFLYMENELAKIKEKFQTSQTEIFKKMDEMDIKIDKLTGENKLLDVKIMELNVEVNELNLTRDMDFDKKNIAETMKRMKKVRERSQLVQKIQEQHNEILVLQTELELLRLKTYPTIKYKIH